MLIKTTDMLKGPDGKVIKDQGTGAEMSVGWLASGVLLIALEDKAITLDEKQRRFQLAMRISAPGTKSIDLPTEDVALLKRLVDKCYPTPLVAGQFALLVDPPATTDDGKVRNIESSGKKAMKG